VVSRQIVFVLYLCTYSLVCYSIRAGTGLGHLFTGMGRFCKVCTGFYGGGGIRSVISSHSGFVSNCSINYQTQ
jgi:hypothetical protein